ncbi:MAG: PH domain-containing protein [Candidatus Azobacteroides sp.]|nr:PH domain-containing protein [Candidatus Azobacteroides sp.]
MNRKVFRSRISVLLTGIILPATIPPLIQMIHDAFEGLFYIMAGILIFVILVFTKIYYVISDDKLYTKVWIFSYGSIDIADIVSVERSYNLTSAPAASLKRLCIRFRKGMEYREWLISPDREEEFIETQKIVNPYIYVNIPYGVSEIGIFDDVG